jgi:hypothetical protein
MAYVSEYGNYGGEAVLVFENNDLTLEQWETLGELGDSDKMPYVLAILGNQSTERWEL